MGFIGKAFKAVAGIFKKVIGIATKLIGGVFGFMVGGKKEKQAAPVNNLNKTLEPEIARKIVFGKIAAPLDVRYWEVYGTGAKFFDEVIALATHTITSVQELYLEQKLAIDASGVSQAPFNNSILTRAVKLGLPGQTALSVGGGSLWTATSKFTGCAHMVLKWNCDEKKLPDGVPSRYTQIVEGTPLYDPRRDSTRGGSGTHRINDQSTWAYSTLDPNGVPIGRNNALQALWYLIGWHIANPATNELVLVAGRGVDYEDINLATFIAGANACEVAGYYTDLLLSTDDDHTNNEEKITCDGLIGRLIDPGGLWSYYANVDDTANIAIELTDADILDSGSVTWNEFKGMGEQFNQISGKYINPSAITLFQPFPYPTVRDATYEANLGKKVRKQLDFQQILDSTVAQRLARLRLNEAQYQGEFQADFLPRAMKAQAWSIVRYTSERFGWTKKFRVWRHEINNGKVSMLLKEVHSSIWLAGTVGTPLVPVAGVNYDTTTSYTPTGVTITLQPMVGTNGTLADGFRISWATAPDMVRSAEVQYRLVGTTAWQIGGSVERDITSITIGPLLSGAQYEAQVRFISVNEIIGAWQGSTIAPTNGFGQFYLGTTGNVNYAAISAAGGTALWANVTGTGRPEDNANVTGNYNSLGVIGGGSFIFRSTLGWGEDAVLTGRPLALTDGRVAAGLSSTGDLNRDIPETRLTSSNVFRRTGGGLFSGDTNATFGSRFNVNAYRNDGTTLVTDALAVTTLGMSSGVTGGGSFIFRSTLGWADAEFTGRPTALIDGRVAAGLDAAGDLNRNLTVGRMDNSSVLRRNTGGVFNFSGDLNSTFGSRFGINSYRNDGVTLVTDAAAITTLGLSGGVTGAGNWLFEQRNPSALFNASGNIVPNGGFKLGSTKWGGTNWLVTPNAANEQPYAYYNSAGQTIFYSDIFSVYSNTFYTLEMELYALGLTQGFIAADVEWFNASDISLGPSNNFSNTNLTWTKRVVTVASPATATKARIRIFSGTNNLAGQLVCARKVKLSAGSIETAFSDEATDGARLDNAVGRIRNPQAYNTQLLLNIQNTTNVAPSYTVNANDVTVNTPAHARRVAGMNGPVALNYSAGSFVVPFSTTWYGYTDDIDLDGEAAAVYNYTTNPTNLLHPNRYLVSSGTSPAAGGGGGTPPDGGGGGGGGGPIVP